MPSIQYMNQSAPFWDFISSLEQQGQNHPFFAQFAQNRNNGNPEHGDHPPPMGPWAWGGWGGAFPHRGPPPNEEAPAEKDVDMDDEKAAEGSKDPEKEKDGGEGPSDTDHEGWGRHRRHGSRGRHHGEKGEPSGSDTEGCGGRRRCGGGRRGRHGPGPHGFGPHGPWGPHGHGHHGHHGRGGFGGRGRGWGGPWGWGRGGPWAGPPFNPIEFAANLFNPDAASKDEPADFSPEADIFDTPSGYVIHVSLPGAKKEDVGVNWDADNSELSIAGVVYRPGDEEFLKTLAVGERKVGPFERKIRLGTRASPANIDAEGISAKLEDGVLRVEVPRLEREGFVEVRKVDIE